MQQQQFLLASSSKQQQYSSGPTTGETRRNQQQQQRRKHNGGNSNRNGRVFSAPQTFFSPKAEEFEAKAVGNSNNGSQRQQQQQSSPHTRQQPNNNTSPAEVFLVLEGTKVVGVYFWQEDAKNHAEAVGGKVITQSVKFDLPGWVKVVLDDKKLKAQMQSRY
jgi:hypothetical protein